MDKAYLQKFPFFKYLNDEEVEFLENIIAIKKVDKGGILYGCGEVCLGVAHVLNGRLRVYMVSDEGREITLYHINGGENCVMSASCVITQITFETLMVAEEDSELLIINSGAFAKLTEENIYVKEFMYESLTERFSQVMWVMQEIIFFGFDRRLAHYILSEYERNGNLKIITTQEKIAQTVNSAREVVSRMLKRFANEGLIEIQHGSLLIKDVEGLKKLK